MHVENDESSAYQELAIRVVSAVINELLQTSIISSSLGCCVIKYVNLGLGLEDVRLPPNLPSPKAPSFHHNFHLKSGFAPYFQLPEEYCGHQLHIARILRYSIL